MITKAGLIQNIKCNIKPEYHIPYFHIDIIVNQMIEEIKKAIIGKQKIVIHGLMKFDTKIVDEKSGIFFAGVDIVENEDGKFYILECNRNPQFRAFEEAHLRAGHTIDIAKILVNKIIRVILEEVAKSNYK